MGGEGPIPYMVIRTYADDHGIAGDDFKMFRAFLGILDNEWLQHVAKRDKAAPPAETDPSSS
ncbi:hypothetical protein [Mesorhizobium sp.]|uniref:hypothetical protein n=1 Tax=Mesorhizobium sp. TaxID=1871066 RepID=UPI0025CF4345|nr:hypothetical protein [Mesorhizobium sp.]